MTPQIEAEAAEKARAVEATIASLEAEVKGDIVRETKDFKKEVKKHNKRFNRCKDPNNCTSPLCYHPEKRGAG